jgi:hypothetical protein
VSRDRLSSWSVVMQLAELSSYLLLALFCSIMRILSCCGKYGWFYLSFSRAVTQRMYIYTYIYIYISF